MLEQYRRIKGEHPDKLVLFRMGDFYEMFFEDALIGARTLKIALTSRDKDKETGIPMCGVPYHALDQYAARLIDAGYSVAICDQVEDAKFAKGLVKREVTKVLTPGTASSYLDLKSEANNYLMAVSPGKGLIGLAYCDLATGEFRLTEVESLALVKEEMVKLRPREILLSEELKEKGDWNRTFAQLPASARRYLPAWLFDFVSLRDTLLEHFKVNSLDGFGCGHFSAGLIAAGIVLNYLKETQLQELSHVAKLSPYFWGDFMALDDSTRTHLEVTSSLSGTKDGSLLGILDRTVTAMGARKLKRWLDFPLVKKAEIEARLDAVWRLKEEMGLRLSLMEKLKRLADLERLTSRIALGSAHPRDLLALKNSLQIVPEIKKELKDQPTSLIASLASNLGDFHKLVSLIDRAISDDLPASFREGGIIKPGYCQELDELQELRREGKQWITRLEQRERERSGIPNLRVRYNNVFGYFIEVTKSYLSSVPEDYTRKQTLVNAERFITAELKDYETKVLGAEEKIYSLECSLFAELRQEAARYAIELTSAADALAGLDVLCSLAEAGHRYDYCRPTISEDEVIDIKAGRHPVVEQLALGERFVPNDVYLDLEENRLLIITGPNMAGKSTYVRQVALIVLMAQIGGLVPAKEASLGVVDRIFARIGASDNLARGQSTFMVEMTETANILNNASRKSLIILDEIGRGTSTYDGISIAWSVAEYISDPDRLGAKTLFATHYHELTELALTRPGIKNYNVAVKEWNEEVIFLRKILEGGADRSYGIQVARLAGLPEEVITKSREILGRLEGNQTRRLPEGESETGEKEQLTLFVRPRDALRDEIVNLDLDNLTPFQALMRLKEIKDKYT
jgi:DNA mismatch repair protein MutS